MLLLELLDMMPEPYTWLDDTRCVFKLDGVNIGIFIEYRHLNLDEQMCVANISFGTFNKKFNSSEDLNLRLTGLGSPRKVFSTVAAACCANKNLTSSDVLILGASDEVKEKRTLLYSIATEEIKNKYPAFKNHFTFKVITSNGSILNILCAKNISDASKQTIIKTFNLTKA